MEQTLIEWLFDNYSNLKEKYIIVTYDSINLISHSNISVLISCLSDGLGHSKVVGEFVGKEMAQILIEL